jgi:NADPH2:quinone reductase
MRRLRVLRQADSFDGIDLRLETCEPPARGPDELLIELRAAGVNRSDVAAAMARMPQAVWPRTPGRDWAGVVIDGPRELIGHQVFGAGGDLGITRDGTHATHLVVPRDAAVAKPATLTLAEAGSLGVPFVTALEGFHRSGMPKQGDVVLVTAVNGMVGQAAAQIAAMHGARIFGVTRRDATFVQPHCPVHMIDGSSADIAAVVRAETGGHGADIVYNTVGSPYFTAANQAMAHGGRQILISTVERPVPFDIFAFYRGQHVVGIDSRLDAARLRCCASCRASPRALRRWRWRKTPVIR